MDIHKPKAWNGWREFLKEYLIIVVGVLTALAAEQGVEWLHWRHIAAEAEEHLAIGIGPDLVNAVEWVAILPCLEARIGELATALQQPGPTWTANVLHRPGNYRSQLDTHPVMPLVVGSPARQWPHVAWDSALASGALTHMPRERVDLYAELYRMVEVERDQQLATNVADRRLSPLGLDRPLTSAERTAFLGLLADAEAQQRGMAGAARQMLRDAQQLGLGPPAKALADRMAEEHEARGACVRDLKLPLS